MSDLLATASLSPVDAAPADPVTAAIRAALIGGRVTIPQAAVAVGVSERSIYLALEKNPIPYVKIFCVRYMALDDLRRALVKDQNTAPRGRGRPRKAA